MPRSPYELGKKLEIPAGVAKLADASGPRVRRSATIAWVDDPTPGSRAWRRGVRGRRGCARQKGVMRKGVSDPVLGRSGGVGRGPDGTMRIARPARGRPPACPRAVSSISSGSSWTNLISPREDTGTSHRGQRHLRGSGSRAAAATRSGTPDSCAGLRASRLVQVFGSGGRSAASLAAAGSAANYLLLPAVARLRFGRLTMSPADLPVDRRGSEGHVRLFPQNGIKVSSSRAIRRTHHRGGLTNLHAGPRRCASQSKAWT